MSDPSPFLPELTPRGHAFPATAGLSNGELYIGAGNSALEVVVGHAKAKPTAGALQAAWKDRRKGRATPVLLIALYGSRAAICGPVGDDPPVRGDVDAGQAARLCTAALAQPDRHAALRFLDQALPSLETRLPGVRNEGLLALHELTAGAPQRLDWAEAGKKARKALNRDGLDMLKALGFEAQRIDNLTHLLRAGDRRTALAVLLTPEESPEAGSARFNSLSPVSYALTTADKENLPWVVVMQGNRLRLYATDTQVGVGRRGRTETFVECQPTLLADDHLAYLWLLFSAEALKTGGSLAELLDSSHRFSGELAARLRERIYDDVVPILAMGISAARGGKKTTEELAFTYQMALTALFRLLFIAYAEDRDLLPYRYNEAYRRRSLKQKAQELAETAVRDTPVAKGDDHWREVTALWRAVSVGNPEWAVPPYNGTLFSSDGKESPVGAALAKVTLPNAVFEPVLRALLLTETPEGPLGPVDFRALGVREFGTIYEGLLESELSVAETDLSLDKKGAYLPTKKGQVPAVVKGEVYLHNSSGVRKSFGSYFTKSFAVEHLLTRALEPALDDHLARLDAMKDEAEAAEAFFDFRIADIAMGSGHFLVAAVDRIEKRLSDYISRRPLPGVRRELANLRSAAMKELGDLKDQFEIEDGPLLRRLIARRCIYGSDLNAISVQLARLAIWIHTFVPGLPLSLLDHNLVHGNALVGIGTVEEIKRAFEDAELPMFSVDTDNLLGMAKKPLERLAHLADTSVKDIQAGREAMEQARLELGQTAALCDILTARPIAGRAVDIQLENWEKLRGTIQSSKPHCAADKALAGLHPLHFPIAFPEVFLRHRPGFDVILGNPPWESPVPHEVEFWARHLPGLRGLSQEESEKERTRLKKERPDLARKFELEVSEAQRIRTILTGGAFPGMGTGDPDTYKAFVWRFWNLVPAEGGRIGVVLPRSALAAKGSTEFRTTLFEQSESVDAVMVLNRGGWVFDDAEHRYTIAFLAVKRGTAVGETIKLSGPYANASSFQEGVCLSPASFSAESVLQWNDTASLPLLHAAESLSVFAQLRNSPRLDFNDGTSWHARPYGEAHSKKCKEFMLPPGTRNDKAWPVLKGESFDLENCDVGDVYGYAFPDVMGNWLESARRRQVSGSAFAEFSREWCLNPNNAPWLHCRVAYRDVARSTDTRTVIVSVVPPRVFLTDKAPYFLFSRGDIEDQIFLYGILRSIPLDWYARRFVETGVKFYLINTFPIPRPARTDAAWQRAVALAGRLACPDDRFKDWARAVGVKHGPIPADEKQDMIHELDAVAARLYGLSEQQLVHIFETFHEGWDYAPRLDAVLGHFHAWAKKGG